MSENKSTLNLVITIVIGVVVLALLKPYFITGRFYSYEQAEESVALPYEDTNGYDETDGEEMMVEKVPCVGESEFGIGIAVITIKKNPKRGRLLAQRAATTMAIRDCVEHLEKKCEQQGLILKEAVVTSMICGVHKIPEYGSPGDPDYLPSEDIVNCFARCRAGN